MTVRKYVEIKTEFDGIHNWPSCPFKEVSFLKYPHRHKIFIVVKIQTNINRQIEFFMLKLDVDNIINILYGLEKIKTLGERSMEKISEEIILELRRKYKDMNIEVSASEDNQVRGVVEYER